ncbi:hypothetical protein chiPu_0012297 [Chiloscyllium punctatum]|uniref:Uncharacterized protein n=1 Tax=Chiloscyllium punctatum TaxID=137246 RepID=A0A401STX8_CHIPU|nr:hypothetical protein [Chiloscyllium punctatum]
MRTGWEGASSGRVGGRRGGAYPTPVRHPIARGDWLTERERARACTPFPPPPAPNVYAHAREGTGVCSLGAEGGTRGCPYRVRVPAPRCRLSLSLTHTHTHRAPYRLIMDTRHRR